ncbi:hypothetical protein SODALDRAFT_335548 [Sodiomyces alkalinus F11]|uniref:CFEM domain-containing protein n=1 Tax=Sodiomyces alkalinus (strain CBS 110278 / VKM F-3762 / F11) TaxID=1314773 RepID=A0A3N2PPL8_SODAK|nr:hypothetical protein SODALDRAFT_335548 [Sodiomyces alkalinus F11]ROT36448.1 hypothetical protein SODALDRAFT_335548 [Sodiomyces alkalinus F11]
MRLPAWAALAVGGLAVFSKAQEMPQCAGDCLATHLEVSSCGPTDFDCICADETLMENVGLCTLGACTVVEALASRNITSTLCKEPIRDRSLVAPIATAVSGSIALFVILIRVWECSIQKEWGWSDMSAYVAWASSVPMNVFEFFMMANGMGKDIWTLTPEQITDVVRYTWVTQVSYIPAINLTKVAILLFFIRVFPDQKFQWICWGSIVHCILFMVSTFIAAVLACIPVEYAWSAWSGTGEGICYDNNAFWWAVSAINIATDLWILALPIRQLLSLQLGTKKKIYLILMFSVGLVITIVSIIRFEGLLTYSTSSNPTYNNVMVATYSVVECNVSVICCCMPSTLACLRRYFPQGFGSTNRTTGSKHEVKSYGNSKSPFPSNGGGIHKSVTHSVSIMPRAGDSDVVELMDVEANKQYAPQW